MEDILKDSLIVLGRIITILPLLLFVTIFMGKRAIGQLPVFDFLIIISLGSIVGADLADPSISHFLTALAVVAVGVLQKVVTKFKLSNRRFGRLITFEPTIVIQNGQLLQKNIKKIGYSIDNILQFLREKDIFDLNEVETAIIESDGEMSVLKKPSALNVTRSDMNIVKPSLGIALPVIVEGKIYEHVLEDLGLTPSWLKKQLDAQGIHRQDDVFYASINKEHDLHVSLKKNQVKPPRVFH
ncbi:DUF421 domain-containing protein [Alkalibacillus aidingensis]|uniref:DUF421 domain-containing protein n=1 Tax=Alkalibacillus aidingensis TaxID=2747607 RepID=UPI00166023A8|nr:DUF421 domain-containing protein [Alkalibacillus aidingensis]